MKSAKRDLIIPFIVIITIMISCGSFGIYWQQTTQNEYHMQEVADAIGRALVELHATEINKMRIAIHAIRGNETIKQAYLKGDRAELYARSKEFFHVLRQEDRITHFYFHQPDRITFLRVHQPDRFGDEIQRSSLLQAQESGLIASDLELGKMGTLVLRTVSPWHDGDKRIGFIELGKELEQFAGLVRQQFPVDLYLFVEKSRLEQTDWQSGARMLGRSMVWDAFPDHVVINQSITTPPSLIHHLNPDFHLPGRQLWYNVSQGEDHFNIARLPVMNARGQEVAFMIVVQDATFQVHHAQWIIAIGIGVGILGGIGLILLFGRMLGRMERKLLETHAELKDREKRLHLNQESALDAIITIDDAGRVVELNPAAEEMFGFSRETCLGKDLAHYIIPPEYRQAHAQALLGHAHGLESSPHLKRRVELPGLRADGQIIDLEVGLVEIHLGGKRFYTAFMHDITERKQLMKSLKETLEVAESASRMKSEFLANMSHEIRTPMNTIIGLTDLILTTRLSAQDQRHYLEVIQKSSDSLLELINSILDLSKIDAGMLTLERIPFDLSGQIENACDALAIKAYQKELELYCHLADDVPSTLLGDPLRLKQVLINLINNAIKFTSEGEVVLRVSLAGPDEVSMVHPDFKEDIWLHFAIVDTGVGIAAEKQALVFERFTQADGSTTRRFGGTGLGLTISKHLVFMMDGTIWLESEADKGSIFHFTARFGVSRRGRMGREGDERRSDPGGAALEGVRVLLADPHATGRIIVRGILVAAGAEVVEAEGVEAVRDRLEQAATSSGRGFDLWIIDDGLLPDSLNLLAALELRSGVLVPDKVVFFLSPTVDADEVMSVNGLPNATVVRKPVWKFRLIKAIRHALGLGPKVDEAGLAAAHVSRPMIPLNILLVEDNAQNQKLATLILEQAGHTVTIVSNGQEALLRLGQHAHDLILMDLQMPEMDGMEATRQIRHGDPATLMVSPQIPIIAVTAKTMGEEEKQCFDLGMSGYLRKPYRSSELLEVIAKVIRRHPLPARQAVPGAMPSVLKAVELEEAVWVEKSLTFLAQFPRCLEALQQAVASHNEVGVGKSVQRLSELSREIGAWKVSTQALRLRGGAEQKQWEQAGEALVKLESHCLEARQALSERGVNP
ncbi:MAG: response regulator [Magnetococcales bacterium]|nr:response regulator [Magnetococcales bacterium]